MIVNNIEINDEHHWLIQNGQITHTDFISMYDSPIKPPAPRTLFTITNNQYPTTEFMIDLFSRTLEKDYPYTLWVQENNENNGIPYCQAMPDYLPITKDEFTRIYHNGKQAKIVWYNGQRVNKIYYNSQEIK